jgi:hypothetical protein
MDEELKQKMRSLVNKANLVKVHGKNKHEDTLECYNEFVPLLREYIRQADKDEGFQDAINWGRVRINERKYRDAIIIMTSNLEAILNNWWRNPSQN